MSDVTLSLLGDQALSFPCQQPLRILCSQTRHCVPPITSDVAHIRVLRGPLSCKHFFVQNLSCI